MNPYTRYRGISFLLFTCALMAIILATIPALAQTQTTDLTFHIADTNAAPGTNAPPVVDATPIKTGGELLNSLFLVLVAVIAPMITRLAKYLIPKIPSSALPFLSPALVWLINIASTAAGGPHVSGWLALILGAAGTGLREVKEQIVPMVKTTTTTLPAIILVGFLSFGAMTTLTGCKTPHLEAGGVYAPTNSTGAVVYNELGLALADASYKFTYESVRSVMKFERDNRAALWALSPDIKHALDKIRPQAVDINRRWAEARHLYKANPTPAGLSALQDILSTMERILAVAQQQIASVPISIGKPAAVR